MIFIEKVVIYQNIKLFHLAGFLAHVQQFSRLLDSLSYLVKPFATFFMSFSVCFLKWNSTLCQVYWISDLQLLKLVCFVVCFVVASTWERKYVKSRLFFDTITSRWRFLVGTKLGMTTCENTSNIGWVLLMFYKKIELTSQRTCW